MRAEEREERPEERADSLASDGYLERPRYVSIISIYSVLLALRLRPGFV